MMADGFFGDEWSWSKEETEKAIVAMGCEPTMVEQTLLCATTGAQLLYDSGASSKPAEIKECLRSMQSTKYKLFNDPVHGSIELHPLLAEIVNMSAFTRLKNIRQLGGVYYVYPGATHTRFEHSIGTCYIAGEFIRMLQRKQPELHITDQEALCVEIAALCHDLGHGPFSHLFEKGVIKHQDIKDILTTDFPKHEKLSASVFKHHIYGKKEKLFNWHGIGVDERDFIKELINHDFSAGTKLMNPERRFLYEIVANKVTGIDVDKWDYFARDCHYMGILTEFDWRRLMALSRVIKDPEEGFYRMCYRDKEVKNIYGMFRTRCSLHQKAYQHKTVIAAEKMIAEAIVKVRDVPLIKSTSSQSGKLSIAGIIKEVADSEDNSKLEGYLALDDGIIHLILQCESAASSDPEALSQAQGLLRRLDKREMFSLIDSEPQGTVQEYISEDEILEKSKDSEKITVGDVYIKKVKISYSSEEVDDPVEVTYFYTKEQPWMPMKGTDIIKCDSELVTPRRFKYEETRIYSIPEKKKEVKRAYQAARSEKDEKANKESDRKINEETPTSGKSVKGGKRLHFPDNVPEDKPQTKKQKRYGTYEQD